MPLARSAVDDSTPHSRETFCGRSESSNRRGTTGRKSAWEQFISRVGSNPSAFSLLLFSFQHAGFARTTGSRMSKPSVQLES